MNHLKLQRPRIVCSSVLPIPQTLFPYGFLNYLMKYSANWTVAHTNSKKRDILSTLLLEFYM